MTLFILDYNCGDVYIHTVEEKLLAAVDDDIEEYISKYLNLKLSMISYMVQEELRISTIGTK